VRSRAPALLSSVAVVLAFGAGSAAPGSAPAAAFPARVFAPYVYVEQGPTFPLAAASDATGVTHYTLAFITDQGSCTAGWDSGIALSSGFYAQAVKGIRASGGDVIVSFGGAGGTELARSCSTVAKLQQQYQAVVNRYHLTRVDFDVEGDATLADTAATARRNTAVAAMQRAAHDAGKQLTVQFTLGVGLDGLPKPQRDLLKNAAADGVHVGVVNLMVMDYFDHDHLDMLQNAEDSANAVFRQLHAIFPNRTPAQRWAMIGLTPMIGENDDPQEVFRLADATGLRSFAESKGTGLIAFWSAARDRRCGSRASDQCSGIQQPKYAFARRFASF
jgi:chitinase